VRLQLGSSEISDLVALGWLSAPDRADKDALSHALVDLIERAIAMRVTRAGSEGAHFTLLRATAGPIAAESDESERLSSKRETPAEQAGRRRVGPGYVELKVLEPAEVPENTTPAARPRAEPTQPFEVDPAELWTPRLDLYRSRRMWMPAWGPRPDQDGCQAPDYLL
jgi:hypothetical protein